MVVSEELKQIVSMYVPEAQREIKEEEKPVKRRRRTTKKAEAEPLPKKWGELEGVSWFYVEPDSDVESCRKYACSSSNRNIRRAKEQAEACVAMAQLSQLMYIYNNGREPDWTDNNNNKYCIEYYGDNISVDTYYYTCKFLAFKTAEIRDKFLENFRELIEIAKVLL